MKKITPVLTTIALLLSTVSIAWASSLIVISDLQENSEFLFPDASYLSGLESHSTWQEISRGLMTETSGIEVTYEAIFDQAPRHADELPRINMYILPMSSQTAAAAQLESWRESLNFSYGTWELVDEGTDYFAYYTDSTTNNDLIKYRALEEASLHLVSYYDNVMFIANFYRESGSYLKNNVSAYLDYLENDEETLAVMNELFVYVEESLKFYLGSTFSIDGPSDHDYELVSASDSVTLTDQMEIPFNGGISFDVYIDDASEIGTILDTNGIDTPFDGSFTVGINENAVLEFSYYDGENTSSCDDGSGWHHLYTQDSLGLYEWQTITIAYGLTGTQLLIEGVEQASCEIYTPRSDTPVYLGDYPGDSIQESFVGYVKAISVEYFADQDGNLLDELMEDMIFADVSAAHQYATSIEYLKDSGIIEGYANGTYRPDQSINRVEILKMLLLGFGYEVDEDFTTPDFSDVDEGAWYLPYLNHAVNLAIVGGNPDGTYSPAGSLNRAEFLKILLASYGISLNDYPITELYPDTSEDEWFAAYVQYSKDNGLMDTDSEGNFNAGNEVTRGEVAETIYRLITG
jgi:hypothetical protein